MTVDSNDTNLASKSVAAFSADHLEVVARPSGEDMSLAITSRIVSVVVIVVTQSLLEIATGPPTKTPLRRDFLEWSLKGWPGTPGSIDNKPFAAA